MLQKKENKDILKKQISLEENLRKGKI